MNREQAGHILDAYVRMRIAGAEEEASDALRAVILDAMTEYRMAHSYYPKWPYATWTDTTKWPKDDWIKITCAGNVVSGSVTGEELS